MSNEPQPLTAEEEAIVRADADNCDPHGWVRRLLATIDHLREQLQPSGECPVVLPVSRQFGTTEIVDRNGKWFSIHGGNAVDIDFIVQSINTHAAGQRSIAVLALLQEPRKVRSVAQIKQDLYNVRAMPEYEGTPELQTELEAAKIVAGIVGERNHEL